MGNLSVRSDIVYRAKLSNGIILEDTCLKNVYYGALRELKDEYGHRLYYSWGECEITYGASTVVSVAPGRGRSGYIELKKICMIRVFSLGNKTYTEVRRCYNGYDFPQDVIYS